MEGRSDGLPFLRMGARTVRYLPTDLDKWLEERRRSAHGARGHGARSARARRACTQNGRKATSAKEATTQGSTD
jgi:hypothetical protein